MSTNIYRPPNWQQQSPAKVLITFPGVSQPVQFTNAAGSTVTLPTAQTLYAFDGEIVIEHEQRLEKTRHPIQTGAAVSDHAFIVPARLVLDIIMTDAIDAYYNPSTWQGSASKSVSAYLTMLALQLSRVPLTVTTRLRTYSNMVIEGLTPRDTAKTIAGLKMTVEFSQIFVANITLTSASARPQDTQNTNLGIVTPQNPTSTQQNQNNTSGLGGVPAVPSTAIGSGNFGSNNVDLLPNLPAPK